MQKINALLEERCLCSEPGLAVWVQKGGEDCFGIRGMADVDNQQPISRDTQFDLASLSKQFTAFVVLELIRHHKISLDDPVSRFLPGHRAFEHALPPVRVCDLIYHTSGLDDYIEPEHNTKPNSKADNRQVLEWLDCTVQSFAPGNKGSECHGYKPETYSNTNYVALALIIEEITGLSFAHAMDKYCFKPANLKSTEVDASAKPKFHRALRYNTKGTKRPAKNIRTLGDGGIFSTIADLSKWSKYLRTYATSFPAEFERLVTPGFVNGKPTRYAFGWQVHDRGQGRFLYHDGSWNGATSNVAIWIDRPWTLAALTHSDRLKAYEVVEKMAAALGITF